MDRAALDMAIAKILAALLVKETRAELQNAPAQPRTDRATGAWCDEWVKERTAPIPFTPRKRA